MSASEHFARAIAAIDAANADDPNTVTVRGRQGPKEILHAELVTEWVRDLRPAASEELLLAARGHHLRRWTVPRSSFPAGRSGYLRWRKGLHDQHARELGDILTANGYDDTTVARVQQIVRKQGLASDPEVQALEDALCLVFLETQLTDIAARLEPRTLVSVIEKTARKMSPVGIAAIERVPLDDEARALLARAVGPAAPVHRYLDALATATWSEIGPTLAADVERIGPYRDVVRGRDEYAAFLERTIDALTGYELQVARVHEAGDTVVVELAETVDAEGGRLRTDEAVVFELAAGVITRVAVYLQTSELIPSTADDS